jgi:hypothetical protein
MTATRDSWKTKPLPEQFARLELDGVISAEHIPQLLQGYVPHTPQDKWFIFYEANWLYFHRATSGSCIFQLRVEPNDDHLIAPYVHVNRDPTQYRTIDDNYDVEMMAYLIDRYLFGRNTPFPTPSRFNKHHKAAHAEHVIGQVPPAVGSGFINLNDL